MLRRRRATAILCAGLATLALLTGRNPATADAPCPRGKTTVVIDTAAHQLALCEQGALVDTYAVSLGRGGVGKRSSGDGKTPHGIYRLGAPRKSARFLIFIPVGYPTGDQRRRGYTGRDIGLHGPDRRARWLGGVSGWFDWTQGCIAVNRDEEIQQIAAWMKRHGQLDVHIR